MKKNLIKGGLAMLAIVALFSFTKMQTGITGKVVPADGVEMVWAINGSDSAKTELTGGSFTLPVKPGTYKVIVDAKDPYKDVTMDNVVVKDGAATDLGEIALQP
ncbi:MAG: carboxypeptidase regulatory-like domain-containing protein [Chitinophagaceae bacterium]|jgi:hypothetical protein